MSVVVADGLEVAGELGAVVVVVVVVFVFVVGNEANVNVGIAVLTGTKHPSIFFPLLCFLLPLFFSVASFCSGLL